MEIVLKDWFGVHCICIRDADILFDMIYPEIAEGKAVIIDCKDIKSLVSLFLNHSVGKLFEYLSRSIVDKLLIFKNTTEHQNNVIKAVKDNSEKYYSDSNYRQTVDQITTRLFDNES